MDVNEIVEQVSGALGMEDFMLVGSHGGKPFFMVAGSHEVLGGILAEVLAKSPEVNELLTDASMQAVRANFGNGFLAGLIDDAAFLSSVRKEILF